MDSGPLHFTESCSASDPEVLHAFRSSARVTSTEAKWPGDVRGEHTHHTPQQVTRRRAYLSETVSNPENLRNCEGVGEGAGVKGHRAFYCS